MSISDNIKKIYSEINSRNCKLIAVTKTKPPEDLMKAYDAGLRVFGENKVQEMVDKYEKLPKDIQWHMIGHLQSNKVKYIAPFVHLIHSIDSFKLLQEVNKQGAKINKIIPCLLQVFIATEETKFGFSFDEVKILLKADELKTLPFVEINGLMGMASNTPDMAQVRKELRGLRSFFDELKGESFSPNVKIKELSMGMSGDYLIAIEEGSTLIRVGSAIFGAR